jgi:hypothetical protein
VILINDAFEGILSFNDLGHLALDFRTDLMPHWALPISFIL